MQYLVDHFIELVLIIRVQAKFCVVIEILPDGQILQQEVVLWNKTDDPL